MVQSADGNSEPVADFPPHRQLLGKLDVVRIRRSSSANEARLSGHKPQVFAIALSHRFADYGDCLFARFAL